MLTKIKNLLGTVSSMRTRTKDKGDMHMSNNTNGHQMASRNNGAPKNGVKLTRNRKKNPNAVTNVGSKIYNPITNTHCAWQHYYRLRREEGIDLSMLACNSWIDHPDFKGEMSESEFIDLHTDADTVTVTEPTFFDANGDFVVPEEEVKILEEIAKDAVETEGTTSNATSKEKYDSLTAVIVEKDKEIARLEKSIKEMQDKFKRIFAAVEKIVDATEYHHIPF